MSKRFVLLTSTMSLFLFAPFLASAQSSGTLTFGGVTNTLTNFKGVLNTLSTVIMGLALIYFFWGMAKFILSAGDEEKREESKGIMLWGIIAFVVMVGIWGIVNFLISAFGIGGNNTINPPQVP